MENGKLLGQARTLLFGGGGCTLSLSGPHVSSPLSIYWKTSFEENLFFCVGEYAEYEYAAPTKG